MVQASSIIKYIELWLPFTSLTESQQRLVIECIETGCVDIANNKRLDTESSQLLFLISSFCHLKSYGQNIDKYNKLEKIIQLKITDILRKLKIKDDDLCLDHTIVGYIIAFNLFKVCCENTNTFTIEEITDTITLFKFIDDTSDLVYHQLNILGVHLGVDYSIGLNKIKHVVVKLLAAIIKENSSILYLDDIALYKTLKWGDYKNYKFFGNEQLSKKNLKIKHTFMVIPNYSILFKLCPSKPLLLKTTFASYVTTNFPPFACSVAKPSYEGHIDFSDEFYKSLISLTQVKMNLSYELLEKQWNLVELDLNSFDIEENCKFKVEHLDFIQILKDMRAIIQTTPINNSKNSINANFIKEEVNNHVQDNKSTENIKYELEEIQKLVSLKKRWDSLMISSIFKDEDRITLENILSIFSTYYIFKKFIEYIKTNNINSWYFLTYSNFLAKFYYDSVASFRSFWGFKYIYKCDNADFSEEEYFRAIGTLFKKEITNADGEFQQDKLIALGRNKYNTLRNLTVAQLCTDLENLTLASEFIYYKHALETPNEAYFVWIDKPHNFTQYAIKCVDLDNNDVAYDTCTIYIRELKKILKKSGWSDTQLEYLSKALLKDVIAAIGYEATFYTVYNKYKYVAADLFKDTEVYSWLTKKKVFKEIYKALTEGQFYDLLHKNIRSNWVHSQNRWNILFTKYDIATNLFNTKD